MDTNSSLHGSNPSRRGTPRVEVKPTTVLNLFPVVLSDTEVEVGVGLWKDREHTDQLRVANPGLHTWRDRQDGSRLYAWFSDGRQALLSGFRLVTVRLDEAPMLFKRILADAISRRFVELGFQEKGRAFVNYSKASLLAQVPALAAVAAEPIGIYAKIIPRVHFTHDAYGKLVLGLVMDVLYTTRLEVPCSEWIAAGLTEDVKGSYIVLLPQSPEAAQWPDLLGKSIGRVEGISGDRAILSDRRQPELGDVLLSSCAPEPTRINLSTYLTARYAKAWEAGEAELRTNIDRLVRPKRRHELASAAMKRLLEGLSSGLEVYRQMRASFDAMLRVGSHDFPVVRLSDPTFSFDPASDRRYARRVDIGLQENGPYDQGLQRGRQFRILVVALEEHRREVESAMHKLENGISTRDNVFSGMKAMYRLQNLEFAYAFAPKSAAQPMIRYADAARSGISSAKSRGPGRSCFDLILTVTCDQYRALRDSENPYFQTKALALVLDGVPTQAIQIEKLRQGDRNLQYILNTMALACYAKVGGTSHVLNVDRADDGVTELIFGIGRSTGGETRHGPYREETIGFATVFRANGQYLYNDCTPYCDRDKYEEMLEATILRAVAQVAGFEGLADGAKLRLIFHVPRRPGRHEERAVLNAVGKMPRFKVEFALVHVNDDHQFQVFDTGNTSGKGRKREKPEAAFISQRGLSVRLGPDQRLVTFIGIDQYRGHGSPGPVLLGLDPRSTVTDIDYLSRQLYQLSFMNVGSLNPGVAPASIAYAEKLARLVGHLRGVQQWTVDLIHLKLGRKLWFI